MYISSLSGIKSLKSFGNLPTQHNLTLHSHYLRDIQNCTQYTVGRLVKNKCRHLLPKLIQNCSPASTFRDRKSTRLNSSHVRISYAVFCLKKKISRDNRFH